MIIEQERDRPYRLLVSGGLFVFLAAVVMSQSGLLNFIDSVFISAIQKHESAFKHAVMTAVSFLGSPKMDILWILIIAFLLWGFKYKIPALWALGTIIGGDIVATLAKDIVQRTRPFGHLAADNGYSFPSGHVFGMTIVLAVLWIVVTPMIQTDWRLIVTRTIMILWLALLVVSRIYLGAHYPSDTLGAMLLAYAWLQISEWLYLWLTPKLLRLKLLKNSIY